MRLQTVRFKTLNVCLEQLEPFIRNGSHLLTGKPFKLFGGLRSRELLANWLTCVAVNSTVQSDRLTFTSDPTGGDGIVVDTMTGETWFTEHVMVPPPRKKEKASIEDRILAAVSAKQAKGGKAYAEGKTLIVFLEDGGGTWFPNIAAKKLPPIDFDAVWVVGLQTSKDGNYSYGVTRLDLTRGSCPAWLIHIASDFKSWRVEPKT